jgi:hypothetical protein
MQNAAEEKIQNNEEGPCTCTTKKENEDERN